MSGRWLDGGREAGSPSMLRRINVVRVLRALRSEGPMSRSAVVAASGLSKPTVNEVVETLLGEGLVIETMDDGTDRPRRPGPRARLLRFNAQRWLVVGVDIGATKILALLSDLDGNIVGTARRRTPLARHADDILRDVRQAIREAIAKAGAPWDSVAVIAVGTPGVVHPETGAVRFAPQLPDWEGLPLAELLRNTFGTQVLVESEAHLAVTGEHWRGVAQGLRSAVFVQIGVGVGMGYLIDGAVYPGAAGAAGEIGYLPLMGDWPPSRGPISSGVFEEAVGASAFVRLAEEAIAAGAGTGIQQASRGDLDAQAVLRACSVGDEAARTIVERIVTDLGRGLACIAAVLNPEVIVLGGGIGAALAEYAPMLEQTLANAVPASPQVRMSSLEDQAVATGALRRGIEYVENRVFEELCAFTS